MDKLKKMGKSFGDRYGKFFVDAGPCPICGQEMFYWKNKDKNNKRSTAPVCPNCSYTDMTKRNDQKIQKKSVEAKRAAAINRMKSNSVVTDTTAWNYEFSNYIVCDEETRIAKKKAEYWVSCILKKEPIHALLTGKPGVGKTHLSFAMVNAVTKQSDYKMSCLVISYRELLEQMKIGLNDSEVYKAIQQSVISDLKKVDFVIVDDLGAELGKITAPSQPTNYNLDTLTSLVEARMNKATIFTSNLNSKQMLDLYGERIVSRIMSSATNQGQINAFRFKQTEDKRMGGVKWN
ncbi:ATP-binding protein [Candidatus Enterococcus courvalinii]|uniref:ATP-binding protein n=1 Tax=Candidatus Enterococcus courvalinii TaxID=2815329 RepID=A0ABS3HZI2_9ENTE|nr:ATP-binding protein [Enterococcus sp. MSG2901]MBO0481810.1 ATP-binding protein [Enterococcus sp. MSG2901]